MKTDELARKIHNDLFCMVPVSVLISLVQNMTDIYRDGENNVDSDDIDVVKGMMSEVLSVCDTACAALSEIIESCTFGNIAHPVTKKAFVSKLTPIAMFDFGVPAGIVTKADGSEVTCAEGVPVSQCVHLHAEPSHNCGQVCPRYAAQLCAPQKILVDLGNDMVFDGTNGTELLSETCSAIE